jgi:hypothetical protein
MMNDLSDCEAETMARVSRRLRTADRFDNYREITAKFDSTGKCGHPIKKGDRIGYNRNHGCHCSSCWSKWSAENREADAIESGYLPNVW